MRTKITSLFTLIFVLTGTTYATTDGGRNIDVDLDKIPDQICFLVQQLPLTSMTCTPQPDICMPMPTADGIMQLCTPMPPLCISTTIPQDPILTCRPGPDNCPTNYNPDQRDTNKNNIGDVCDLKPALPSTMEDPDGDGMNSLLCGDGRETCSTISPPEGDNCAITFNPDQADADQNGVGDVCEKAPEPPASSGGSSSFDYWGCTNFAATNFNKLANKDDGTCSISATGEVLGASTTVVEEKQVSLDEVCYLHKDEVLKYGDGSNDPEGVKGLQKFLNVSQQLHIYISGIYNIQTRSAVKVIQEVNSSELLTPWATEHDRTHDLKYWLLMTKCGDLNLSPSR